MKINKPTCKFQELNKNIHNYLYFCYGIPTRCELNIPSQINTATCTCTSPQKQPQNHDDNEIQNKEGHR